MATKSKNPYGEFYTLLAKMPFQTKEIQVYEYSGQTHLPVLYKNNYPRYMQMIRDMRKLTADPELEKMNDLRKQAIAAVGQWFTEEGLYEDLSKEERLEKIKATAVFSTGSKRFSFNKLTGEQLIRVTHNFNDKKETKRRVDSIKELMSIKRN